MKIRRAGYEFRINDLPDWEVLFLNPEYRIVDEYGNVLRAQEMLQVICDRKGFVAKGNSTQKVKYWLEKNYATLGPDGLVRFIISEETLCRGHGEGPWDLVEGEFS